MKHIKIFATGLFLLGVTAVAGCGSSQWDAEEGTAESASALAAPPAALVEQFPTAKDIDACLDAYGANRAATRVAPPMAVPVFFGTGVSSSNIGTLSVERLAPPYARKSPPIAFLSACFRGGDMYWNDRNKDVQLYHLFESAGLKNVFPDSRYYADTGCSLVRIWSSYRGLDKGRPPGMDDATLRRELAKVSIVAYVAGNVDGPSHNPKNAGFTQFKDDKTGETYWSAVVIDNGASWNWPADAQKPWNSNLLGIGPVVRTAISDELTRALVRIAESTRGELATASGIPQPNDGAKAIVENERTRARDVLDHYGIEYRKAF